MTNMSQFSGEMDEISFAESSSIFDETNISKKVIICENVRQPVRTLFNQTLGDVRVFIAAKTQCSNRLARYGDLRVFTAAKP